MGQRETLIHINTDDFFEALGIRAPALRRVLAPLMRPAAARFADEIATFDRITGEQGLQAAGAWLICRKAGGLYCAGAEAIPTKGPLLIVSNHPGITDTVALFATIDRPDLRIVANDRPFLRALTHVHDNHLIDVSLDPGQRVAALRTVIRALRTGCAALTFPAGHVEPDPDALPGAEAALESWASSIGLLVKMVPGLVVLPALVRGVVEPRALRNPLSRLRRSQKGREHTAGALQVLWARYQHSIVWVAYGPALSASALLAVSQNADTLTRMITDEVRHLLNTSRQDWRVIVTRDSRAMIGK